MRADEARASLICEMLEAMDACNGILGTLVRGVGGSLGRCSEDGLEPGIDRGLRLRWELVS